MTRSFSFIVWFGLVILASLALYHVSDRTQKLDQELRQLNAQIDGERQSLHIIKANYVYLANPERIEKTAKRFLALQPPAPQHIAGLTDIADFLPTRGEALATVAVNNLHNKSVAPTPQPKTVSKGVTRVASVQSVPAQPIKATHVAKRQVAVAQNIIKDTPHFLPSQPNIPANAQRTASAVPLPDSIGSLITELGSHP